MKSLPFTLIVAGLVLAMLAAMSGAAWSQTGENPANPHCKAICEWHTRFPSLVLNSPFPGINLPAGQYALPPAAKALLGNLGYVKTGCGEGGCTYKLNKTITCPLPCQFLNQNGVLQRQVGLNYLW